MELTGIRIEPSPRAPDRVRLVGTVAYDDRPGAPEEYWFEVADTHAASLSQSANPWLVALIPLAVTLGEPLRLALPVDRTLLDNVHALQEVWRCWYPRLSVVDVEAPVAGPASPGASARTAAFFSGGVDSFFTVLRRDQSTGFLRDRIDDLLCVWGFDVPLDNGGAFTRIHDRLQGAADGLGRTLVDVATNLRITRWRETDWAHVSHGCALAAVALCLEPRYRQVLIAASDDYWHLHPWGTHALTDPLLSTSHTAVRHDGAGFTRLMKTEIVAGSDVAMRTLRVCWKSRSDENCGRCEKCYRTMLSLELYGALSRCATFGGATRVDLRAISRLYLEHELWHDYREIQAFARRRGQGVAAAAIERSLRRSARIARGLAVAGFLRGKRVCWRMAKPLERLLLARSIT